VATFAKVELTIIQCLLVYLLDKLVAGEQWQAQRTQSEWQQLWGIAAIVEGVHANIYI
jgi:hypothetical protein